MERSPLPPPLKNSTTSILMRGFAVQGIGSLAELVNIGPMQKLTFLVGRNNHGKSTILRASKFFCEGLPVGSILPTVRKVLGRISENDKLHKTNWSWNGFLQAFQDEGPGWVTSNNDVEFWLNLAPSFELKPEISEEEQNFWNRVLKLDFPSDLSNVLLEAAGFPWAPRTATMGPKWCMVPAFRQIAAEQPTPNIGLDTGAGLIRELQRWQMPDSKDSTYNQDLQAFTRLTELLQDVLEDPSARLFIPHSLRTIQLVTRQHGTPLDIDELGDGIKQVLMIGATALRHSNTLICLEEPEIHLHPGLQRKLIEHLRERTDNQYLIATHSTHILDSPDAAVFHIVHDGMTTRVVNAVLTNDLVRVSEDLGCRASDLLQANYIVWVEGPADRLYWRRWLELIDPHLQEGVHYTTITYGGSLLANYSLSGGLTTLDNPAALLARADGLKSDLIDLLKLGRNCTIIADSDKRTADGELRALLRTLQEEARGSTGEIVSIEEVRTVENLVPPDVLELAVRSTHNLAGGDFTGPTDRYFGDPFENLKLRPDKSKIARAAVALLTSSGQIEVESHLNALHNLARRIRYVNGIVIP